MISHAAKCEALLLGQSRALFSEAVGYFAHVFPNPRIRTLAGIAGDVIGHGIVPVALESNVTSVSFMAYQKGEEMQAVILLPLEWEGLIRGDTAMQLGAVLFNISKAVDVYNGLLDIQLERRATMFEAEYLLTLRREFAQVTLNAYQKHVLTEFPQGLDSEGTEHLRYESKPFFVNKA